MSKTPDTDLNTELDRLELDLKTKRLVTEKLLELDELLPDYTLAVIPPDAAKIIEDQAAKRGVTPNHYISEAMGHVTGLGERGIWIGDFIRKVFANVIIDALNRRTAEAGLPPKEMRHDA